MKINDKLESNPHAIAEQFNNYFSTIAKKLENKLIPTNKKFSDYLKNNNIHSLFIRPTSVDEVKFVISAMNKNKSTGPNSLHNNIINIAHNILALPLSHIINLSFISGVFPDNLKIAQIIPIHKKDDKLLCDNYRPISLLSNISKIIEKLMHYRLSDFLKNSNILYTLQFGFRSKYSTNHALIQITEKLRKAIDDKNYACGVFIDLQKAFDTVNHDILIAKLYHYGIRGIASNWFKSYLKDRKQYVCINGCNSNYQTITHGVPQGSVLGPLLFILYINDLHNAIAHSTTYHFADDTNLTYVHKSIKTLNKHINHDLKLLIHWLRANKISLNTGKTEIIIFKSKHSIISKKLNFRISGQKILPSSSVKYLGLAIDEHLNWDMHLHSLKSKLARANGMLAKVRHFVPKSSLQSIYYAIFNSHLNYGCQVWGQNINAITNTVYKEQKKAIRIINFKQHQSPVDFLFYSANILKIYNQITLLNCLFVFDFMRNNLPQNFNDCFKLTNHQYLTRAMRNNHLTIPQIRTTAYGLNSITYKSVKNWNELMDSGIIQAHTINHITRSAFQDTVKKYLLEKYIHN